MKYIRFLPFLPFDKTFEYQTNDDIFVGDIAFCKFGTFYTLGIVMQVNNEKQMNIELANFGNVIFSKALNQIQIDLLTWMSNYYAQAIGILAKMFFPFQAKDITSRQKMIRLSSNTNENSSSSPKWKIIFNTLKNGNEIEYSMLQGVAYFVKKGLIEVFYNQTKFQNYQYKKIVNANIAELSESQKNVLNNIFDKSFDSKLPNFGVHLIHGKTGSGKTEVYIHLVQKICKLFGNENNPQILILLPEIGLAKVISQRFENRFDCKISVWHSSTPEGKRKIVFQEINSGACNVIIGTRSALFLPFKNLKCIIIDEEHDSSYKQEENPIYNARDVAIYYAKLLNIPIVLGSATPSVESYFNAQNGKFYKYELLSRFSDVGMPDIKIINEKSKFLLSKTITEAILQNYLENKQTLVFINRRGFSPINKCKSCNGVFRCDSCDAMLIFHKQKGILTCHHCNFEIPKHMPCVMCGEELEIKSTGAGVEAIYEEIIEFFEKNLKNKTDIKKDIAIFSSDEQNTENKLSDFLDKMQNNKIKIVVGTQIAAKGYDFPHLKLVCIIDLILKNDQIDFKSDEKVMQLLTQVSGRSGRANEKGLVLIQSRRKKEFLDKLLSPNQTPFYESELNIRKDNFLPPFSRFVSITIFGKSQQEALLYAENVANIIRNNIKCTILGPAPAPIAFIKNIYRFKILLITEKSNSNIQLQIKNVLKNLKYKIKIDVDSISFF